MKLANTFAALLFCFGILVFPKVAPAQPGALTDQLQTESVANLAAQARQNGDPIRGAIVFHQSYTACTKCHTAGEGDLPLGPDLARVSEKFTPEYVVESILMPSKVIKKGFQPITVETVQGKLLKGLMVEESDKTLTFRDLETTRKVTLPKSEVEAYTLGKESIMPTGLVNQLTSRQQFLDLVRYVTEVAEHGPKRALELRPNPSLYAARPLPEYEQRVDHAGLLTDLDDDAFERGKAIYNRLCINCHGTHDRPGSLPTSLRFAKGKFKNGADPFTMYQTLTRGFGMMAPQTWMVPQQKYDVIHYVREAYLKDHNESQFVDITDSYLAKLPQGDTRGPAPRNDQPWILMDYGPSLIATYETPGDALNFAYKGIAMRLDPGPGGVSRGRHWMIFDHDTLRMSAAWSGQGFIDWNGIMLNGRHGIHPKTIGTVSAANPVGPGWANPQTGDFKDPRLRGRDGRPYGPLPRDWAHLKGIYNHGQRTIVSYTVGATAVLESPDVVESGKATTFLRTLNIGPRDRDMTLQVARAGSANTPMWKVPSKDPRFSNVVAVGGQFTQENSGPTANRPDRRPLRFDGATRVELAGDAFDMFSQDFSITARIRTKHDGPIFTKTKPANRWAPNGKTLFVRGGRLNFDIGWVGVVRAKSHVADGEWHDIALTWNAETAAVHLYVDGKLDGQGRLKPKAAVKGHLLRIGYTSPNFPGKDSYFRGDLTRLALFQRELTADELADQTNVPQPEPLVKWNLAQATGETVAAAVGRAPVPNIESDRPAFAGTIIRGGDNASAQTSDGVLVVGLAGISEHTKWVRSGENLRLSIAAGTDPIECTLWMARVTSQEELDSLLNGIDPAGFGEDLTQLTQGGSRRWTTTVSTTVDLGEGRGPFAVDVLRRPATNPWNAQIRLTGFDFYADGDRMAVSSWDGDVWLVSGLHRLTSSGAAGESPVELTWQRIASGLYQPLGLKIVDGKIFVSCRDQIAKLHDLNGDNEIDFVENFNNDHQVTEHFHEFAMGLQTDDEGNFYYAKSARHALPALVPHHGTLLRVSHDGHRTDILATGFRAANGVCLNPDGTFIVTDQEGHWNPKNRINWVKPGGFYGNMYGYHDVTDSSDDAMDQPLCWITNAFDRSPAELLWVDSDQWGPLDGSLLNFSYGYGKVYVVPHEKVRGQVQGGMCELPLPQFPTGVMRGRFRPQDGQLFACGMFAWGGSQHQPGGMYRIRYTGKPVHLPVGLKATRKGVRVTFSAPLDPQTALNPDRWAVKTWALKRTKNYGSKHYDEQPSQVTRLELSEDRRSILIELDPMQPTWCMEIVYSLRGAGGEAIDGQIHNTIHRLPAER